MGKIRSRDQVRAPLASRLKNLAGICWASPVTLLGLLVFLPAVFARDGRLATVRHSTPALLITGPLADRMLARHPLGNVVAMALGHIVIAQRNALCPRLLEHELAHVRQAARWGPVFPLAYVASSAWQACRGRRPYRDNAFEVDARTAERYAERRRNDRTADQAGCR